MTGDEFSISGSPDPKWAWVNQGGATATVANGQLRMFDASHGGDQIRFLYQPYSGPIVITAAVWGVLAGYANFQAFGVAARNSSTGKFTLLNYAIADDPCVRIMHFNSASSFGGDATPIQGCADLGGYLQFEDDGTNLIFRVARPASMGTGGRLTFVEVYRELRSGWLTGSGGADQFGFTVNSLNGDVTMLVRFVRTGTTVNDTEVLL